MTRDEDAINKMAAILDELSIELQVTAQDHAQHRLTPRDVNRALVESMRLAQQAKRLSQQGGRRVA